MCAPILSLFIHDLFLSCPHKCNLQTHTLATPPHYSIHPVSLPLYSVSCLNESIFIIMRPHLIYISIQFTSTLLSPPFTRTTAWHLTSYSAILLPPPPSPIPPRNSPKNWQMHEQARQQTSIQKSQE